MKSQSYFNGNIADFRMYNNSLSPREIWTLYNDSKNPSPTKPTISPPMKPTTSPFAISALIILFLIIFNYLI